MFHSGITTLPSEVALRKKGSDTRYIAAASTQTSPGKLDRLAKKIRLTVKGAKIDTKLVRLVNIPISAP